MLCTPFVSLSFFTKIKPNAFFIVLKTVVQNRYISVLKETVAPAGYILNNNGIYFKVAEDGTLYIKNSNGEYEKSNGIIIYNEPVEVVIPDVPKTGLSSTITYVVGTIALLSGAMILFKNEKKC